MLVGSCFKKRDMVAVYPVSYDRDLSVRVETFRLDTTVESGVIGERERDLSN